MDDVIDLHDFCLSITILISSFVRRQNGCWIALGLHEIYLAGELAKVLLGLQPQKVLYV